MKDFKSKTLDKTFDYVIFAEGISPNKEGIPSSNKPKKIVDNKQDIQGINITKAQNGNSLEELFKDKKSFHAKDIIVKGKVVKVNNGIMDKNWVHLVDGTSANQQSDLTVTTLEEVKVGDIVTFKGKIAVDKDFGKGYKYDIILEEAKLVK